MCVPSLAPVEKHQVLGPWPPASVVPLNTNRSDPRVRRSNGGNSPAIVVLGGRLEALKCILE